jgi:hypothetical protein
MCTLLYGEKNRKIEELFWTLIFKIKFGYPINIYRRMCTWSVCSVQNKSNDHHIFPVYSVAVFR